MTSAFSKRFFSPEEYLAMEETADYKSEYYDGAIFAMAGGSFNHNLIASNILAAISRAVAEKPCFVFGSDMRLQIEELKKYTYADVTAICGQPLFMPGRNDTITNPLVVVEVLSPTTMKYDQQGKFRLYKSLPSLQDYLLVDQYSPYIQYYHRLDADKWLLELKQDIKGSIEIAALDLELSLETIYHKVIFEEKPEPKPRARKK
ncbi:Uma2 family endonuclease [Candidatus Chlorohelix sp.]|uniref:Uma2 family endonuclease n=1 Tax=Candidatus Chlorohelix sp. TaxID=3139201 RepID=UPI003050A6DA